MSAQSKIEWTDATWNPIVGCSIVSPGCTNCYAMRQAARIERMSRGVGEKGIDRATHYDGTTKIVNGNAVWTGKLQLAPERILLAPLQKKKPTTYFVNSMGDLFHESIPDEWIDRVFAVMALCPQHTFQVLTKRAERMREYVSVVVETFHASPDSMDQRFGQLCVDLTSSPCAAGAFEDIDWPLPNVWLGISAERQQEADERIPLLLQTPAAVRFVSCEPLLGQLRLDMLARDPDGYDRKMPGFATVKKFYRDALTGRDGIQWKDGYAETEGPHWPALDWVIVGGESGPNARPMHPDWARSLRDQCKAAGVPFFFKQWGNWHPEIDRDNDDPDWRQPYSKYREPHFQMINLAGGRGFHGERVHVMRYSSKKSAGRLLDGVEHSEFPATPPKAEAA